MPRPPRRAAAQARPDPATPTSQRRPTNAITATIPPFMLETPPHAPFLTTPLPPSTNPGQSIVPNGHARISRSQAQQTPSNVTGTQEQDRNQSRISTNALGSAVSEPGTAEEQSLLESVHHAVEDQSALQGLREISSLATWTLSSAKPGCALPQLRHPSPLQFWQSDGPQPHTLTLHFFKLVAIVKMRIYLDFDLDESYTPTKMRFYAGMSENGLVEFGSWQAVETTDPDSGEVHSSVETIRGWLDVPLKGVGGRERKAYEERQENEYNPDAMERDDDNDYDDLMGGDILKAMVVQLRICENHQNGKDTHVRGFQIFAKDETGMKEMRKIVKKGKLTSRPVADIVDDGETVISLQPAEWMRDPEIR